MFLDSIARAWNAGDTTLEFLLYVHTYVNKWTCGQMHKTPPGRWIDPGETIDSASASAAENTNIKGHGVFEKGNETSIRFNVLCTTGHVD